MNNKFLIVMIVWMFLFVGCSEGHKRHRTHRIGRRPVPHQRVHHSSVRIGYSYRSPSHKMGYKRPPMHSKGRPGTGRPSSYGRGRPGIGRPSTHGRGKHGCK